jgi:prefoldin alpha subunit
MKADERLLELEVVNNYLERIQQQVSRMHESLGEIGGLIESLDGLDNAEVPSEGLFPFANGIFVKGTINSKDSMLVNVGQGIVVEKSLPEVRLLLEKQRSEILEAIQRAESQFDELVERAQRLQTEIEAEQ